MKRFASNARIHGQNTMENIVSRSNLSLCYKDLDFYFMGYFSVNV